MKTIKSICCLLLIGAAMLGSCGKSREETSQDQPDSLKNVRYNSVQGISNSDSTDLGTDVTGGNAGDTTRDH